MFKTAKDIALHDLQGLLGWNHLRKVALAYPLLLAGTVIVTWPGSFALSETLSPSTLLWWAYLATYLLGRVVISTSAHTERRDDEIQPGDWMRYGNASAMGVIFGKLLSGLSSGVLWVVLATPTMIIAGQLVPINTHLIQLYLYWLVVTVALTLIGTWATLVVLSREMRAWILSVAWLGLLLIPLLPLALPTESYQWFADWSPLFVVRGLTESAGANSLGNSGQLGALLPMGLLALTGFALSLLELGRWRRKDSSSTPGSS